MCTQTNDQTGLVLASQADPQPETLIAGIVSQIRAYTYPVIDTTIVQTTTPDAPTYDTIVAAGTFTPANLYPPQP